MITDYMTDNQVIVITGARGTGKTFLAYTYAPPDHEQVGRVYAHDSERSGNRVIKQLGKLNLELGRYVPLSERFKDLPEDDDLLDMINKGELPWVDKQRKNSLIDYYQYILDDLKDNLKRGKYDVYIHDTLEKLEAGMAAWVDENKRAAGVTRTAYGGLWTEGVYPLYENFIEAIFARGVKAIILTSHLKNPWEGNRPVPGKVAPSGKKLLYRLSSFMVWLVNERKNADGAPAGLILKERLGELAVEDGMWKPKRMLPERIPHCTWNDIADYLKNGCDIANPADGEVMTDAEREMISPLLTDAQMKLMIQDGERELLELQQQTPMLPSQEKTFEVSAGVESTEETEKAEETDEHKRLRGLILASKMTDNKELSKEMGLPLPRIIKLRKEINL